MALETVDITAGSGTSILVDGGATGKMQVMKLALSAAGSEAIIPATLADGLLVDVSRVAGNVTVVQPTAANLKVDASDVAVPVTDNGSSLTVDAPQTTPVFVRLSDGVNPITALPITDNGGLISVDDGAGSLTVDGTVAVTKSGTWTIDAVTSITNVVNVADNGGLLSVDDGGGSLTVDGTVTADQGAAAALSGGWPVKITDGTVAATITTVGADECIDVNVVQTVGPTAIADKGSFVEGTTPVMPVGAVFNDTIAGDPAEDQITTFRITAKKGLHANLRDAAGVELGTVASPLKTDPSTEGKTILVQHKAFTASQTDQLLLTPTAGRKFVTVSIHVKVTGAGDLTIFDETDDATHRLLKGTYAVDDIIVYEPPGGRISATVDNKLEYTTGAGATGDIVVYGYDSN